MMRANIEPTHYLDTMKTSSYANKIIYKREINSSPFLALQPFGQQGRRLHKTIPRNTLQLPPLEKHAAFIHQNLPLGQRAPTIRTAGPRSRGRRLFRLYQRVLPRHVLILLVVVHLLAQIACQQEPARKWKLRLNQLNWRRRPAAAIHRLERKAETASLALSAPGAHRVVCRRGLRGRSASRLE
jgi:hypothetical protein